MIWEWAIGTLIGTAIGTFIGIVLNHYIFWRHE